MLGALCHDLGKPSTTAPGEKQGIPRIRSLGHEAAGEEPTQILMDKWAFGEHAEHAHRTEDHPEFSECRRCQNSGPENARDHSQSLSDGHAYRHPENAGGEPGPQGSGGQVGRQKPPNAQS
jgi:hypothetical protein